MICKRCFRTLCREEEKIIGLCDDCYDFLYSVKDAITGEE